MQRDMHYYGTYAMARAAGLAPNACQIIATAAEFVDDNGDKEVIEFPDGGRLDFVPTAHHTTDIENIDRHDQRLVWVPFHFIPGNEGRSMSERLLCRKDSEIAREMIDHNLSLADKTFGLHLAGITAHVYADTFSHYGFSGVSSRWNRIDASSFEFYDVEPEIQRHLEEKKNRFRERYGKEMGHLPNIRNSESWNHHLSGAISRLKDRFIGTAAEILSGALGHGAAVTYPDRPFLRWQFTTDIPRDVRPAFGIIPPHSLRLARSCMVCFIGWVTGIRTPSRRRGYLSMTFEGWSLGSSQRRHPVKHEKRLGRTPPRPAICSSDPKAFSRIKEQHGSVDLTA